MRERTVRWPHRSRQDNPGLTHRTRVERFIAAATTCRFLYGRLASDPRRSGRVFGAPSADRRYRLTNRRHSRRIMLRNSGSRPLPSPPATRLSGVRAGWLRRRLDASAPVRAKPPVVGWSNTLCACSLGASSGARSASGYRASGRLPPRWSRSWFRSSSAPPSRSTTRGRCGTCQWLVAGFQDVWMDGRLIQALVGIFTGRGRAVNRSGWAA